MEKTTCPGCGSGFNGKRCRSCGYEPFGEVRQVRTPAGKPPVTDVPGKKAPRKRRKRPLVRFFVLLYLIYSLMPMLRNWGFQLEAIEDRSISVTREPVVPEGSMVTLYQQDDIHIFTTAYDAEHFDQGLTLYVQNDSDQDLEIRSRELLINDLPQSREIFCKAGANAVGKNWLRFDLEDQDTGTPEIRSVAFRLEIFDTQGNCLLSTEQLTFRKDPA